MIGMSNKSVGETAVFLQIRSPPFARHRQARTGITSRFRNQFPKNICRKYTAMIYFDFFHIFCILRSLNSVIFNWCENERNFRADVIIVRAHDVTSKTSSVLVAVDLPHMDSFIPGIFFILFMCCASFQNMQKVQMTL